MAKNYRFLLRYISRRAVELFDAPYEFPSCTRWPDRVVHLMKPREVELTPGTTLLYKPGRHIDEQGTFVVRAGDMEVAVSEYDDGAAFSDSFIRAGEGMLRESILSNPDGSRMYHYLYGNEVERAHRDACTFFRRFRREWKDACEQALWEDATRYTAPFIKFISSLSIKDRFTNAVVRAELMYGMRDTYYSRHVIETLRDALDYQSRIAKSEFRNTLYDRYDDLLLYGRRLAADLISLASMEQYLRRGMDLKDARNLVIIDNLLIHAYYDVSASSYRVLAPDANLEAEARRLIRIFRLDDALERLCKGSLPYLATLIDRILNTQPIVHEVTWQKVETGQDMQALVLEYSVRGDKGVEALLEVLSC